MEKEEGGRSYAKGEILIGRKGRKEIDRYGERGRDPSELVSLKKTFEPLGQ